jgi:transposase
LEAGLKLLMVIQDGRKLSLIGQETMTSPLNLPNLPVKMNTSEARNGFVVLPKRWIVELTFAWLGRYRRLSKDYEPCVKSSEGMVYIASIHFLLKRATA